MELRSDSGANFAGAGSDHAHGAARRRIFVLTWVAVFAIGLIYTVFQPRVYQSSATVLMSAPTAIDQTMLEADIQGVAIQRRILTGGEITSALAKQMGEQYQRSLDTLSLRGILDVAAIPDTNLLELRAAGSEPSLLPVLVETWIEVYSGIRARDIEVLKSQTLTEVGEELEGLDTRLTAARQALADYREEHEIISMERQENAVLAQLDGLNTALNNAVEEEVRAKAYLDTLEASRAAGEQFVPESERAAVSTMASELESLRSRLVDLRLQYTEDYILKDPRLREIPQRVADLESALARAYAEGTTAELDNARRAWNAARETVSEIAQRLEDHKASVSEFNTIYARHESLVEDLARIEELNRETQARQVQIEVRQTEKYPQMAVIDWPRSAAERIGPPYLLLIGASLLAATLLAVFATWLYSYLHPRSAQPAFVTLSGVHMYPQDSPEALAHASATVGKLGDRSAERIEQLPGDSEDESGESDEFEDPERPNPEP